MVYYLLMVLVLVLAYPLLEHKPSIAKKFCYVLVVFVSMMYISILRYGLGNDYFSYIYHFNVISELPWNKIFTIDFEPGFVILNKLISLFTQDTNILYTIYAIIILLPMAYVIFRYSDNIWMSTVMFISLTFFYCTLSFIRQSIALSIIFLAYKFFVQRKHFFVLLFIFFACLFHSTVVVLIPVYLLAVLIKPTWKSLTVYGVLTLLVYLFSTDIINLAVKILPQYERYTQLSFITSGYNPIYIITPTVIMCVALFAHFTGYGKAYPVKSAMFTNFAVFNFIIWLMSTKHFVIERFSMYPYLFMIMFIPSVINYYRQRLAAYRYANRSGSLEGFIPDESVADPERVNMGEAEVVRAERKEEEEKILAEIMSEDKPENIAEPEAAEEEISENVKSIAEQISENVGKAVSQTEDGYYDEEEYDEYSEEEEYSDEEAYEDEQDAATDEEQWKPQNYVYRKSQNKVLNFIRHPVTIYTVLLTVVLGINLWYNYFGLNVNQFVRGSTSNSFHGVMPYKSIFPPYNELELSLEDPADKDKLLHSEEDMMEYLYRLKENKNYIAVVSTRGDSVSGLNSGIRGVIKALGMNAYNQMQSTDNYAAIIQSGKVTFEQASHDTIEINTGILGYEASILSSRANSKIVINGKDYSVNGRGINIVVLDINTRKVVDKVSFKGYYVMLTAVRP